MSAVCDIILAMGLTFGGLCTPPQHAVPPLPPDDKDVWGIKPVAPVVAPPAMPPVVIERTVTVAPTPTPAPPAPLPVIAPRPPNPYRIALQSALYGHGPVAGSIPGHLSVLPGEGEQASAQLASLSAAPLSSVALPLQEKQEKYQAEGRVSGLPVDNSRILAADRYISGVLETGINSQLDSKGGGQVIIQTSRDVFGYHERNILVPKGSRLICDYGSPRKQGETRLTFNCGRILMAGYRAEILQLVSPVGDVQGRGGLTGDVDNRFWEKYGTAFVLAGISTAVRLAAAAGTTTSTTTTGTTTTGSTTAAIADKGAQELSQKFGEISAANLESMINLAPIITIPQGTRLQIRPTQDWYIRRLEDGPPSAGDAEDKASTKKTGDRK